MPDPRPSISRLAIASTAALSLFAVAGEALALSPEAMIKSAESACLESAAKDGWRTDLAKVISAKALDADKVEVIFDLTKDGTNTARLTCPYSVSQGVGAFGGGSAMAPAEPMTPAAPAAPAVDGGRAWWLLLPIGLALLAWAALRGRETSSATAYGSIAGSKTHGTLLAQADARDGKLEVREHPDMASTVLRQVRNGDSIGLTGARRNDWLEVANGGWVRDADLRYDRNTVTLG